MRFIILSCALLATMSAQAAQIGKEMPSKFIGEWQEQLSSCGKHESDSVLRIKKNSISFYEAGGPVKNIRITGSGDLSADAVLSTEQGPSKIKIHYQLSQDGKTLTDLSFPPEKTVRKRCSGK